jgi:uncharacterized protein (DUF1697 family)
VKLVAFLRAINVGGHTVSMDVLRKEFAALGLKDVDTFIASGNVIFTAPRAKLPPLERRIEARLRGALGYEVRTFLGTEAEVAAVAGYKPFADAQMRSAYAVNVAFMAGPLLPPAVKRIMAMRKPVDDFHVNGRELYWLCRTRQSESRFTNTRFEKTTATAATFRGLPTIVKLATKYSWSVASTECASTSRRGAAR